MQAFQNRFDTKYKELLVKKLSIDGDAGLVKSSIKLEKPKIMKINGKDREFHSVARIHFCGISSTTLLDINGNHTVNLVARKFEELLANLDLLNDKGIFLKANFLFSYPYSDFTFSLILAETTKDRPTIDNKEYTIGFDTFGLLDEETFYSSNAIRNQTNSLKQIQFLVDRYKLYDNPNKLQVRFTPVPINLCTLIINNSVFSDPYLYAKGAQTSDRLFASYPLLKIRKDEDEENFNCVEDHFRYLWTHPSTIFCNDATEYEPQKKDTLHRIKKPYNISFHNKAKRMQEIPANSKIPETQINSWKFRQQQLLINYTRGIQKLPNIEKVFIACSWEKQDSGNYSPNINAKKIKEFFNQDFGEKSREKSIYADYVVSEPGGHLFNKIYSTMRLSTLGIIILSKDIKSEDGRYYSKPNIYQELGFLLNQLNASETRRVLILCEHGVEVPTNVQDFEHIKFNSGKLDLVYCDVIKWLQGICFLSSKQISNAKKNYKNRLLSLLEDGQISHLEYISTLENC